MKNRAWIIAFVAAMEMHLFAQILTNGSFEVNFGMSQLNAVSTSLPGWIVASGSIDVLTGPTWVGTNGVYFIDLNGSGPGSISQSFPALISAETYRLSFWLSGNPYTFPGVKYGTATIGGNAFAFSFDSSGHSPGNLGWIPTNFDFYAAPGTTVLLFQSNSATNSGPLIDGVVLRHGS